MPKLAFAAFVSIVPKYYRSSKWHYRQRKNIFELIMHFIADTDADEYSFGNNFP